MKQISILAFFLVAFLGIKAQVNPESFPTVTPLGTDNVYSQTGGVTKKFTVSDIARLARNGVNGQDSSGLGGSLLIPTIINQNGFPFIMTNGDVFSGNSGTLFGSLINANSSELNLSAVCPPISTTVKAEHATDGTGVVGSKILIFNSSIPSYIQFANSGDSITGNINSLWQYANGTTDEDLKITLTPSDGFQLRSTSGTGTPYSGVNLFRFFANDNVAHLTLKSDGKVNVVIQAFNDDADAGANGLVTGDVYELSSTNTLGLPAGILMKKQ